MKMTKEKKLAFKITAVLFILLIFSFGILIYLNFYKTISGEKNKFLKELKFAKNIRHYFQLPDNFHNKAPGKKLMRNLLHNVYFYDKQTKKIVKKGVFEDLDKSKLFIDKLKKRKIEIKEILGEKFFVYKIENKNFLFIFGKNINHICEALKGLLFISIILGFVLLFIIYFISLKLAYITTDSIRKTNKKLKEYNHNLAHELKTPLSVIKSDLELLEMGKKFDGELMKSSKTEIISMQEIIDSLLFLSQKQNNFKKEKINLFEILSKLINKKEFIISTVNEEKNNILAEKKLIEILFKNLLDNALKYGKKGEKIEIILQEKFVIIKNKIDNKFLNIDKEKLFETFYKGDNSRNTSGYGLGLNIVKKIALLHNFEISIDIKENFFIVKINF